MSPAAHPGRRNTEDRRSRRTAPAGQEGARPLNALLQTLPPEAMRAFRDVARPVSLMSRAALHQSGETLAWVYFVEEGLISIRVQPDEGRDVETHTVGAEGAVGLLEVLGGGVTSASAYVSVPGVAWRVSPPALRALQLETTSFMAAVARHLETVVDEIQQGLVCHAVHGVDQRLSRWLLERQERLTGETHLPVLHACLATGLGVQRTSITEAVQRLQGKGLVVCGRGAITILDAAGLEQRSCACRQALLNRRAFRHDA